MTTQLYKRDGKRFIKIENHEGMYYQIDGTFQKERDENSIGFCTESTAEEDLVFALQEIDEVSYLAADRWQKEHNLLPTPIQLINAICKYKKQLGIKHGWNFYWINTVLGYVSSGCGFVALRSSYSDDSNGGVSCLYVLYDSDNRDGYGSRSLRKVIHVKK